ncbi:MAG: Ig domain-containing protein, partial [Ruminococcus sp.]|nr:Ig domain-containing protein [Ruminococcus sp.]
MTLDPAVANQVGFVDGDSSITLTYGDGNSDEGFAEEPVDPVIIDNEPATVDPESVTVDPTTKTLTKHGETFTIDATVLPEETTDKTVLFQSDNSNVALVDSNGTVTAGIDGVANIIARASKQGVQATTVVTVAIEHTADDLAYVPGDPADCQHDGTQGYWICSYCGKMFADENGQEEISEPLVDPQTDHTPGEPVEENIVPPTCTEQGHFDQVVYCEVCGEELSREVMYTGYAEHDLEYVEAESATCTTPGHEACYKCSVCNKLFADAEGETEIDAAATTRPLGHDDTG